MILDSPAPVVQRPAPPSDAARSSPAIPLPAWLPEGEPEADVLSFLPPGVVIPPAVELDTVPPAPDAVQAPDTPPVGNVARSELASAVPVAPLNSAVPDWLTRIAAAPPSPAATARFEERRTTTLAELAAMQVPGPLDRPDPVPARTAPAPSVASVPFLSSPAFKVGVLAVLLLIVWKAAT